MNETAKAIYSKLINFRLMGSLGGRGKPALKDWIDLTPSEREDISLMILAAKGLNEDQNSIRQYAAVIESDFPTAFSVFATGGSDSTVANSLARIIIRTLDYEFLRNQSKDTIDFYAKDALL